MYKTTPHLQGTKKSVLYCISMVLGLSLALFTTPAFAKTYDIAILSSGSSPIYSRIINIIKTSTKKKSKTLVTFNTLYADNLTSIASDTINNADLLVTIGKRAMILASHRKTSPPILATLVPRQSFKWHYSALKSANNKVAAIYIGSAPERQIILAKILMGNRQTVGILLSDESLPDKQHITSILKIVGLKSNIVDVSPTDNVIRKLTRALKNSDTLLALSDPLIFNRNTARDILLTTYRQRIPVIGFSANYVKAGALAAVFSTTEQIAVQTSEEIREILDPSSPFPSKGKYPKEFTIAINQNVARSLGISTLPNSLIKKELEKEIVKLR